MLLLALPGPAPAQGDRFRVAPFVGGLRFGSFPPPPGTGLTERIERDDDLLLGGSLSVPVWRGLRVEALFASTRTSNEARLAVTGLEVYLPDLDTTITVNGVLTLSATLSPVRLLQTSLVWEPRPGRLSPFLLGGFGIVHYGFEGGISGALPDTASGITLVTTVKGDDEVVKDLTQGSMIAHVGGGATVRLRGRLALRGEARLLFSEFAPLAADGPFEGNIFSERPVKVRDLAIAVGLSRDF